MSSDAEKAFDRVLLFALAVEPLAIWLQSENGFEGITRYGQLHKISFHADYLLLFISNTASSLPIILDIFEKFDKYSGYKLNLGKSDYIPINPASDLLSHGLSPFRKATDGLKYLGILGAVHTGENDLFVLRLPRHRFKNICVHTDPLKTTENVVVLLPGL